MRRLGNFKKSLAVSFLAGMTILPGIALANETEDFETFVLDDMVVTATRTSQSHMNVPAGVSVVTSDDIERKGALNLADALHAVPGVVMSRNNGRSGIAYPLINGSDQVAVLIDGIRVNAAQGLASGSSGLDLNSYGIDVNAIERIEVVRGGGSTLYGSDAVGGIIQIFTKKGDRKSNYVGVAFGDDSQQQYKIGTSGRDGKFNWRINGSYYDTDGYRENGYGRDGNLSMRLGQDIAGGEAFVKYDYTKSKMGYPGAVTNPTLLDYGKNEQQIFATGYVKDNFSLQIYHKTRKLNGENWGDRIDNKEKSTGILYQDSQQIDERNLFTWGADLSVSSIDSLSYGVERKKRWARALYIQDTFTVDNKLILIPGIRYDGSNDYGSKVSPKLGLVYKIKDDLSYFANWGKVYKAPNFDDLYFQDAYGGKGNPNLKPESGWAFETGVKKKFGEKHEIGLTYFKRQIKDRIAWIYPDVFNLDSYRAEGVTLTWNAKFGSHWQFDTNYTYVDTDTNNKNYNESNHQFALSVHYENRDFKQSVIFDAVSARDQVISSYVAGRGVINTTTQYKIGKKHRVYLNIYNLLDKQYVLNNYYGDYPANGRSFIAGWDITF